MHRAQFVCASGLSPDGVTPRNMPGCPAATAEIDILIPRSIYYTNYSKYAVKTLRSLRSRHLIGWYTSGVPTGPGTFSHETIISPYNFLGNVASA